MPSWHMPRRVPSHTCMTRHTSTHGWMCMMMVYMIAHICYTMCHSHNNIWHCLCHHCPHTCCFMNMHRHMRHAGSHMCCHISCLIDAYPWWMHHTLLLPSHTPYTHMMLHTYNASHRTTHTHHIQTSHHTRDWRMPTTYSPADVHHVCL